MAKNPKKVLRKIAVTFLFVGRFLRSIHQKTVIISALRCAIVQNAFVPHSGPIVKKPIFDTPEVPKVAADILPHFFLGGLIFHMRRAASESFFVWGDTTYP